MKARNVLIAAPPSKVQEALQVLLADIPAVRVTVTADVDATLATLQSQRFALVILDGALSGNPIVLARLQGTSTASLVLVEYAEEVAPLLNAGADVALVKGYPAARLLTLINQLLEETKDE
jgi:DNA-binding NarL/FixJ family response regulator